MGKDQTDVPLIGAPAGGRIRRRSSPASPPPRGLATAALVGLFVLALLYTLHVARVLVVPVLVALLLDFLLGPLVRSMRRWGIPEGLGAGLVVLGIVSMAGLAVYSLSGPAADWLDRAPRSMDAIESKLRQLRLPLETVEKTVEAVEDAANPALGDPDTVVTVGPPPLLQRVTGGATAFFRSALTITFLAYFLLAAGDKFLVKLVGAIPELIDKKKAVRIARDIECNVSRYLRIVTLVNVALGTATWGLLALLGMPNAALWGAIAALLNFVPYIGPMVTAGVIGVAALLTFDSVGRALLMPGAYLLLNLLESNLISPMVLGRQFPLNPVTLFVAVLLGSFLWGIPGAILAGPLLVTLKIFCDHLESLAPIGTFLGD